MTTTTMQAPDEDHPIFLPGKILRQLSSDAQRGILDGFNIPQESRNHGEPTVKSPREALGWYNNHFTDLNTLGERLVGADARPGSPSDRYARAMNEMRNGDRFRAQREVPLELNYGQPSGDELGSGNSCFGR